MALSTTRWDSAEYLKSDEDIRLYLEACLEEAGDDPAFIVQALGGHRSRPQHEPSRQGYRPDPRRLVHGVVE